MQESWIRLHPYFAADLVANREDVGSSKQRCHWIPPRSLLLLLLCTQVVDCSLVFIVSLVLFLFLICCDGFGRHKGSFCNDLIPKSRVEGTDKLFLILSHHGRFATVAAPVLMNTKQGKVDWLGGKSLGVVRRNQD